MGPESNLPPQLTPSQPILSSNSASPTVGESSSKEYVPAVLLSYFFGQFGVDRFYLGYTGVGIAKLLTIGGLGVWSFVDFILILFGKVRGRDGLPLKGYAANNKVMKIVFIIACVVAGIVPFFIVMFMLVMATTTHINTGANTSRMETNVNAMAAYVDSYYVTNGRYPTYQNMTDTAWIESNLAGFDPAIFQDSNGATMTVSSTALKGSYGYQALSSTSEACDNVVTNCTKYQISVLLPDGTAYVKKDQ